MKSEHKILTAFFLNLFFSVFEFIGGIFTGSVAILSDALHDLGDAVSIALSFFLEKKSKKEPDEKYTCGYGRYSVLGGFITTSILIIGSVFIIIKAAYKFFVPAEIDSSGMLLIAVVGVVVNLIAAIITKDRNNVNQRAVNLHMLEDVLGWICVLAGAVIIKLTNLTAIDPLLSIAVSLFILYEAICNLKEIFAVFLGKTPDDVSVSAVKEMLLSVDGVCEVKDFRIITSNGEKHLAAVHIVCDKENAFVKENVRKILKENGIEKSTVETSRKNPDRS